jgi:hypothetical protein
LRKEERGKRKEERGKRKEERGKRKEERERQLLRRSEVPLCRRGISGDSPTDSRQPTADSR